MERIRENKRLDGERLPVKLAIDPTNQITSIYRPNQECQAATGLGKLSGKDLLPRFTLDLAALVG